MDIRSSIKQAREGGNPVVGCFPLYPPLEIFHSMGLRPIVLWGLGAAVSDLGAADRHVQNYVCSVGRQLAQFVLTEAALFDGLFFYNACDTLRNLPEILLQGLEERGSALPPTYRIHLPMAPAEQVDSSEYFAGEIEGLIAALESGFGVEFSEERFADSARLYATMRGLCIELEDAVARGRLPFTEFCSTLTEANFLGVEDQLGLLQSALQVADEPGDSERGARVILSGILPPPPSICRMIEESGLAVVGNDIASMRRSYAHSPRSWSGVTDYYEHFYAGHFPCTTLLYSADRRPDALVSLSTDNKADGFIFVGEKFCEYEYFELPYITQRLKEAGIPVLSLEISVDDTAGSETFRTRIEAFAELIGAGGGGGHGS
ncbi:MAG: 2-hydroxyacyl-CoA dehydratase subunit D [Candidatus Geothermincolia bacterium]